MTSTIMAVRPDGDRDDMAAARADLNSRGLADWIAEKDADAPPITKEQCQLIAGLLSANPRKPHE